MPFMTRIPGDLARWGLTVELNPGWATLGNPSFGPGGVTCHWTAGPRGTSKRPSLGICINGRPGVPGPLCNIYLARDGTCVVVAAGRANHAGAGGYRGLVGNSAVYGIEAESGGDGDWTEAQRWAYPRLCAALMHGLSRGAEWVHGHNEWAPTRKIDIRDWPMSRMRTQVGDLLRIGPGGVEPLEDIVTDDDINKIADAVWAKRLVSASPRDKAGSAFPAGSFLVDASAGHGVASLRFDSWSPERDKPVNGKMPTFTLPDYVRDASATAFRAQQTAAKAVEAAQRAVAEAAALRASVDALTAAGGLDASEVASAAEAGAQAALARLGESLAAETPTTDGSV